jgi:stage II sporulation protein P
MVNRENGKSGAGTLMTLLLLVGFLTIGVKYFNFKQALAPFAAKWENWLQNGVGGSLPTVGKLTLKGKKAAGPLVAILYAHPGQNYGKADADGQGEIVEVGSQLAMCLEEKGIQTLHEAKPPAASYSQAQAALADLGKELKAQYPSLKIIVDLHRDAAPETLQNTYKLTVTEEGTAKKLAKLLFLLPEDRQLALTAGEIWSLAEKKYPGLLRGMVRSGGSPGVLTVMVGDWQANTLPEAKASARLLGELLSQVLD